VETVKLLFISWCTRYSKYNRRSLCIGGEADVSNIRRDTGCEHCRVLFLCKNGFNSMGI